MIKKKQGRRKNRVMHFENLSISLSVEKAVYKCVCECRYLEACYGHLRTTMRSNPYLVRRKGVIQEVKAT